MAVTSPIDCLGAFSISVSRSADSAIAVGESPLRVQVHESVPVLLASVTPLSCGGQKTGSREGQY